MLLLELNLNTESLLDDRVEFILQCALTVLASGGTSGLVSDIVNKAAGVEMTALGSTPQDRAYTFLAGYAVLYAAPHELAFISRARSGLSEVGATNNATGEIS